MNSSANPTTNVSPSRPAGETARVCVVGNAAIDLTLRVARLPLPGETSLATDAAFDIGGKGANQAVIAARAGASTQLFAALGRDADGDRILARLKDEGIDTRAITRFECATDLSIVTVDATGENTIVTRNDAADGYRPDAQAILDATRPGDWIVLQGNLSADVTADVLRHARIGRRRTLFNPGPVRFDCVPVLDDVDILVVNRVEAESLTALDDPMRAAAALHGAGAREVLITLGAAGVLQYSEIRVQQVAAVPVTPVDTAGAGDAFCGTLVAALAQGVDAPLALRWAQSVAAHVVERRGTQASFPDRAAMRNVLSVLSPLSRTG